jgi:23S rRNA (adenine2030-N6)-methyltransferase
VAVVNYRHVYHAGNFADCVKHALLLVILRAMQRKDKPLMVLDTHAGVGIYDVFSLAPEKTGEWRAGIARVMEARPAALADYVGVVERQGLYPGSPAILASLLRAGARLVCCELHPEDAAALKAHFAGRRDVAVHLRDGYAAVPAFLPPPERRALVLIDPPYEDVGEFEAVLRALVAGWQKFRSGVFVVWYPVKSRARVRAFFDAVKASGLRDVVGAEFLLREPSDPARLNGCGLMVVNPPFGFEGAALPVLRALVDVLGEAGAGCSVTRLVDE